MTTVSLFAPELSGTTGLMLKLTKSSDYSAVNGSGDTLTESVSSGWFTATVAEVWTEKLAASVVDSEGLIPRAGWLGVGSTVISDVVAELDSDTLAILNDIPTTAEFEARTITSGNYATASQINSLQVNTRASVQVPGEIETPDSGTQIWKIRLFLFDSEGNMEAPDSTPTVTLVNASGTDRSSRLSSAATLSTGAYAWDYTSTADDAEEQLIWTFTVIEGGLTRLYPATTRIVEETEERFTSTDRSTLNSRASQTDVTTVGTAVAAVDTKLGTPAGATVSEDIYAAKAAAEAALLSVESIAAASAEAY